MKTLMLIIAGLLLGFAAGADTPLRIGVAAVGSDVDALISDEASRAPYFLIFDQDGELIDAIENRDAADRRAGPQTARLLVDRGVTHYIARQFGRNLIRALDDAGIHRVEQSGPARNAVHELIGTWREDRKRDADE